MFEKNVHFLKKFIKEKPLSPLFYEAERDSPLECSNLLCHREKPHVPLFKT